MISHDRINSMIDAVMIAVLPLIGSLAFWGTAVLLLSL